MVKSLTTLRRRTRAKSIVSTALVDTIRLNCSDLDHYFKQCCTFISPEPPHQGAQLVVFLLSHKSGFLWRNVSINGQCPWKKCQYVQMTGLTEEADSVSYSDVWNRRQKHIRHDILPEGQIHYCISWSLFKPSWRCKIGVVWVPCCYFGTQTGTVLHHMLHLRHKHI